MARDTGRVVAGKVESEHIVQLFDTLESAGAAAADFLDEGLARGAHALLVVKTAHLKAIAPRLAGRGWSMAALLDAGRMTVFDAHAIFRTIIREGKPDPGQFEAEVAGTVRRLAAASPVPPCVYGEVVELFAEEGNFRGAQELEELWNGLAADVGLTLLCGYSSAHFASPDAGQSLERICQRHTRVQRSPTDMLGEWLLGGASSSGALNG